MASPLEGLPQEGVSLTSGGTTAGSGTHPVEPNGASSYQTTRDPNPIVTNASSQDQSNSENQHSQPVVLYSSLSVDYRGPYGSSVQTGSAQIVERDLGGENDFWNIHLDFVWKPRGLNPSSGSGAESEQSDQIVNISVDEFLTLRLCLDTQPSSATIHLRGGKLLGEFQFPNGPDAAMAFLTALRLRVDTLPLADKFNPPQLYALEKKPRMRRVAPSLSQSATAAGHTEEDYSSLLQDLSIRDTGSSSRGRHRRQIGTQRRNRAGVEQEDFGMMVLSQFARVTQVAREVGEEISTLLDEKKRRAEAERKERERAARRRALDIYADIVASTDVERELPPRLTLDEKRGVPVSEEVWNDSLDGSGKLKDPAVIKQAIFSGGVDSALRCRLWPFILGFYDWGSSRSERDEITNRKQEEYEGLKAKWSSLQSSAKSEDSVSLGNDPEAVNIDRRERVSEAHAQYLETEEQIAKDIIRTDRELDLFAQDNSPATLVMGTLLNVYATYDNRITYCQGMSDFLSPIIHVIGVDNESLVFWCFECLMRRIEKNFRVDQSGMRSQLSKLRKLVEIVDEELAGFFEQSDPDYYCCFRWVLVRFKRELPFDATAQLWEVMWTRQVGGDDLHIYIAAALLVAHRRQLLSLPRGAFDSLLRYVNDMSMRIDVDFALREGELCFRKYGALMR